jgi:hypothetical protein
MDGQQGPIVPDGSSAGGPPAGIGRIRRDAAGPSWSIVRVAVAVAMAAIFLVWLHSEPHKAAAPGTTDAPIVATPDSRMPPRPIRKEPLGG